MLYDSLGEWRSQLRDVFTELQDVCKIECNQSCGFHVHVSPTGRRWNILEVKRICIAVLHFERAVAALLPPHRQNNYWAKPHGTNVNTLKGKTEAQWTKLIQDCKDIDDIILLMHGDGNRYFAWNFENLAEGKLGTIEWRQPCAMTTYSGCIAWIELAVTFVQAARKFQGNISTYPSTVSGLREFLFQNGLMGAASRQQYLNTILNKNKLKAPGWVELVTVTDDKKPSSAMLKAKVKEDSLKNIMLYKLRQKAAEEARAAEQKAIAREKARKEAEAAKKNAKEATLKGGR